MGGSREHPLYRFINPKASIFISLKDVLSLETPAHYNGGPVSLLGL